MRLQERRDHFRWVQEAWLTVVLALLTVVGCTSRGSAGTNDGQGSIAEESHPWADGEDCSNWGCREEQAARSSLIAPPTHATACSSASECASGFCVDGVCCDTACNATCQACTAAKKGSGTDGVCGNIALYGDPDNECPSAACDGTGKCKSYNGVTCGGATECLSGYCADGYCCGAACTETCRACSKDKTGGQYNGQCENIPAGADPDDECVNGNCNGSAACTLPTNLLNGVSCSQASQCLSGYCADGVCCGASCTETCRACTAAKKGGGVDGECGYVKGATDPENECTNSDCNGSGACKSPTNQLNGLPCTAASQCASGYCADGVCCGASCTETCRACTAAKKGSGLDGVCGPIAANTDPDNECVNTECNGSGACSALLANGNACLSNTQCASGFCADGVCCNTACTGTCVACTAAKKGSGSDGTCGNIKYDTNPDGECVSGKCSGNGSCQYSNGNPCSGVNDCLSGYCVDGVCCGGICSGTCMACSAAKKCGGVNGACGPVAVNTDPDNECNADCNGSGACGLAGNGASCTNNADCTSSHCEDGVCCATSCSGTCMACNVAGSLGTCTNVPAGQSDPNASPPCSDSCDGSGVCQANPGSACTSGSQCSSRVCDNQVCAAVTPPAPLAWMTILKQAAGSSAYYMDLDRIATSADGSVKGGGIKVGGSSLGPFPMYVCCYNAMWSFNYSATGFPISIADGWMDDLKNKYTHQYGPLGYDNVHLQRWQYTGATTSVNSFLSTPTWNRGVGNTNASAGAGMGGHVLLVPLLQEPIRTRNAGVERVVARRVVRWAALDPCVQRAINVHRVSVRMAFVAMPDARERAKPVLRRKKVMVWTDNVVPLPFTRIPTMNAGTGCVMAMARVSSGPLEILVDREAIVLMEPIASKAFVAIRNARAHVNRV